MCQPSNLLQLAYDPTKLFDSTIFCRHLITWLWYSVLILGISLFSACWETTQNMHLILLKTFTQQVGTKNWFRDQINASSCQFFVLSISSSCKCLQKVVLEFFLYEVLCFFKLCKNELWVSTLLYQSSTNWVTSCSTRPNNILSTLLVNSPKTVLYHSNTHFAVMSKLPCIVCFFFKPLQYTVLLGWWWVWCTSVWPDM